MPQPQLPELAKSYLLAESSFNRAYLRFWHDSVKPCSDDMAWQILDVFRANIEQFCFKYGRKEKGIANAAWELFRLELVGEAPYQYADAVGFVKWYGAIKGRISQAISHLFDFHGDGFGDLVDSYPLSGRQLIERALATHPKSNRPRREGYLDECEIGEAVLEKLGIQWQELICNGAQYVQSVLERECRKCYMHRVLERRFELCMWTEEEEDAVSFASHYDD